MSRDSSALPKILQQVKSQNGIVLVLGLGISGVASADFLNKAGLKVRAVEKADAAKFYSSSKLAAKVQELKEKSVELVFDYERITIDSLLSGVTFVVTSPGVSPKIALLEAVRARAIPQASEFELGVALLGRPTLVVTGSNGKSTTVSLLHELMQAGGYRSLLCGNIGDPVIAQVNSNAWQAAFTDEGVLVLEASSYQLESSQALRPKVGVFLNLSENHLERHGSLQNYRAAKARLFLDQSPDDFAVLNRDDASVWELRTNINSQVLGFGRGLANVVGDVEKGAWIDYRPEQNIDRLYFRITAKEELRSIDLSQIPLGGVHNRYNIAASVLAAAAMGVSDKEIILALMQFRTLSHRLEPVVSSCGILFFNDSKSTTVASTVAALGSIRESHPRCRISLLIGGQAKKGSWVPLTDAIKENLAVLNPVLCFGKDGPMLGAECAQSNIPHVILATMQEAVTLAKTQTKVDDIVLLSPGCASFDQFSDFEHRGDVFKSMVRGFKP